MSLLEVKNLCVDFISDGVRLPAVSGLSFSLKRGEILSIVGESGCGKSVSCLSLARLLPVPPGDYRDGSIVFRGGDKKSEILSLSKKQLREFRRDHIAYIFQEPSVSLNPVFRIGDQISEALLLRRDKPENVEAETIDLLARVGIPEPGERVRDYPHQLSGGMQQRVMIAMALASRPEILVADEPTTALDVTIQAQILELLKELRENRGMSIILVTHNFGIVADMADRVIVMYAGHMVEAAEVKTVLANPLHPYTRALLSAVPRLEHGKKTLATIPGAVPSPREYPGGCRFYGRCALADSLSEEKQQACIDSVPEWEETGKGHFVRCHYSK